jgi:hypothetical protein
MHEPLLAQAALAANPRIYGLPLRDYSLGHELFLIRENSAFLFGGEPQPKDIFEAVWICSSTWTDLLRCKSSFFYIPQLCLLKRAAQKINRIPGGFEKAVATFKAYREQGCSEFPMSDTIRPDRQKSTSRDPGTPFILRLQQFLMLNFRLTEAQAWDYPVGLAKMRWAA